MVHNGIIMHAKRATESLKRGIGSLFAADLLNDVS